MTLAEAAAYVIAVAIAGLGVVVLAAGYLSITDRPWLALGLAAGVLAILVAAVLIG